MTDTVTKLMELAQAWADQEGHIADPLNTHEEWELSVRKAKLAKQALEAELTRLFTPLTEEQIITKWMDGRVPVLNFAREIEAMHGITGDGK